jgi:citrate lyase beta subunit
MELPLVRSVLITPSLGSDRLAKAGAVGADLILIDLEDSVPAELKDDARQRWQQLKLGQISKPVGLRINPVRSVAGLKDLLAAISSTVDPCVIVIPKAESAYEISLVAEILTSAGRNSRLWAILETAKGVAEAVAIAVSEERLVALNFGTADYAADIGTSTDWDAMLYARSKVVQAAAAAGIAAIDSPTFEIGNDELLKEQSRKSKDMGFAAKVAIHPRQVPIINNVYGYSLEEVKWATNVVKKLERAPGGIAVIDGTMVGPPALRRAKQILAAAQRA